MALDQFTEAIVTLSAAVERARVELDSARRLQTIANARVVAAERQLELTVASLTEAIRAKASLVCVAASGRSPAPSSQKSGQWTITPVAKGDSLSLAEAAAMAA